MKLMMSVLLRLISLSLILFVFTSVTGYGQQPRLQITNLERFEAKSIQTVEVTLDGSLLQLASKFLSSKKPDEAKVKELISGLQGIYVRSYEFDKEGVYTLADIESLRTQLRTPGWTRIVGVRTTKPDSGNVDVYISNTDSKINGLAIIAAEPKELTVVNIVGSIDLEKLSELEGQFGIPRLGIKKDSNLRKE